MNKLCSALLCVFTMLALASVANAQAVQTGTVVATCGSQSLVAGRTTTTTIDTTGATCINGTINATVTASNTPTDTDDGSVAGAQTVAINAGLGYVWNGSAWVRAVGDATNGLLVNLGSNNDVTVTGSVTANAGTNLNTSLLGLEATQLNVKTATETTASGVGATTVAKCTTTDTTACTLIGLAKQLNYLVGTPTGPQLAADSNAVVCPTDTGCAVAAATGALVDIGAKADAKSTATDTTAISLISIAKEISYMEQNPASRAVTNAGTFAAQVTGTTAVGASYSGAPVNVACKGVSAEQTAVTNGQEVNCIADLMGKTIVLPYANPENFVKGVTAASITDTTSTEVIASAGGSLRNYITHCTVSNGHATVGTYVKILDGATIIDEVYAAAAGGGASLTYPVPLRGTAATAINAQPVTTGSNIIVACSGYKGV